MGFFFHYSVKTLLFRLDASSVVTRGYLPGNKAGLKLTPTSKPGMHGATPPLSRITGRPRAKYSMQPNKIYLNFDVRKCLLKKRKSVLVQIDVGTGSTKLAASK
jgi:hypothetical protein